MKAINFIKQHRIWKSGCPINHKDLAELMEQYLVAATSDRTAERADEALRELKKYNRIHNDLEAYLYEIIQWGLREQAIRPNPKDFGIE